MTGDDDDKQRAAYQRLKKHIGRFVLHFGGGSESATDDSADTAPDARDGKNVYGN